MSDLHSRLASALDEVTPHPAPVGAAVRQGKRLRWRRRIVAGAGMAAVIATAILVPQAIHLGAAPAPGTGEYTVTVQPPGPHAPADEVAAGTVNGLRWDVRAQQVKGAYSSRVYLPVNTANGSREIMINFGSSYAPRGSSGEPVNFGSFTTSALQGSSATSGLQVQYGDVWAGVTYVRVRFGNGDVATLHPVAAAGSRMIAFVAPVGVPMAVTAYGRTGEIATAIPFAPPDTLASFGAWLRPGQPVPHESSGVIGSGPNWQVSAYIGPWGLCLRSAAGGGCAPTTGPAETNVLLFTTRGEPVAGTARASVTRIVFTFPHGATVTVRPVNVGGYKFFAFTAPGDPDEMSYMAYDVLGHVAQ